MWCRARAAQRVRLQRMKIEIGKLGARSTLTVCVGHLGSKPDRCQRPERPRGDPPPAPRTAPLPRKAHSRIKFPGLLDPRGPPPRLLLGHDVYLGQTCSSEFLVSKPSSVNAESQCGCWPSSPSLRLPNASSSAWASRKERRLSRRRARLALLQTLGRESPLLQISIRRHPATGTLALIPRRACPLLRSSSVHPAPKGKLRAQSGSRVQPARAIP